MTFKKLPGVVNDIPPPESPPMVRLLPLALDKTTPAVLLMLNLNKISELPPPVRVCEVEPLQFNDNLLL